MWRDSEELLVALEAVVAGGMRNLDAKYIALALNAAGECVGARVCLHIKDRGSEGRAGREGGNGEEREEKRKRKTVGRHA